MVFSSVVLTEGRKPTELDEVVVVLVWVRVEFALLLEDFDFVVAGDVHVVDDIDWFGLVVVVDFFCDSAFGRLSDLSISGLDKLVVTAAV